MRSGRPAAARRNHRSPRSPRLGAEDPQGTADQADRAIGMSAATASVNLPEPAPQQAEIGAPARNDPVQFSRDPGRSQTGPGQPGTAGEQFPDVRRLPPQAEPV